MIVLDASAALEFLLGSSRGQRVRARMSEREDTLHAPHIIDLEVVNALRRLVRAGHVDESRAHGAIADLHDFSLRRYPHGPLVPRIWELRSNASAYDASYLALGEALGAPLLTCDARVAGIPGHRAQVEVI